MNKFLGFLLAKKVLLISILLIIVIVGAVVTLGGNGHKELVSPQIEDLVRTVSISGKVAPEEGVDLAFETSGTISSVLAGVGDEVAIGSVLVRLNSSTISADIKKAEADLASAEAELAKLDGGQIYENTITTAKQSLVQAMRDVYTAADDAVYSKTDQLFTDPQEGNPKITEAFTDYENLRKKINSTRELLGAKLKIWKVDVGTLSTNNYSNEKLALYKNNLSMVELYLSDISRVAGAFDPLYIAQTTIDKYRNDILLARNAVNTASQRLITEEGDYKSLLADVPVQVAKVEAARAYVQSLKANLEKMTLFSPINGVISRQDAKVGQSTTGSTLVSIISRGHMIEAYVPEVSIAGILIGNTAVVTLDAYGKEDIFLTTVSHIDPAETIRDGVSTYRVELAFNELDSRIRSGMTANIDIETFRKAGVILIPVRAIVKEDGVSYVYIHKVDKSIDKIMIEVGERDSSGRVELLGGLNVDDKILVNPPN